MEKIRYLLIAVVLTLTLAIAFCLTGQGVVNAGECRIVRLHGGSEASTQTSVRIEPKNVLVTQGTCVIWVNWVRGPEVKVIFEEGKACDHATDASVGFKMDGKSCYVTNFLSQGETTSLRFNQKGTFKYKVEGTGRSPVRGEIIVTN